MSVFFVLVKSNVWTQNACNLQLGTFPSDSMVS